MSDLPAIAGCPRKVVLQCGESVEIAPLKVREWASLQQWIRNNVPSPLAVAVENMESSPLSKEDRQAVLSAAAMQPWPPRAGSRGWLDAIDRAEDQRGCFQAILTTILHDDQTAARLCDRVTGTDIAAIFQAAWGMDDGDPNA